MTQLPNWIAGLAIAWTAIACRGSHAPPTSVARGSATLPATDAAVPAVALDPTVPLRIERVGTPMQAARTWINALVPNNRNGWNFITQSWEYHSPALPEYAVVDLEANTATVTEATQQGYGVTKYIVRNQLRAPNGRVFIPLSNVGLAYYDPADERVHELPPVISPPDGPDKIIYSARFGPDGMLYGGTQSNALPTIVQIDPNTLKTRVIGHVGVDRKTYSYAYDLAIDPPWIYAAVGELPWELAAINIKTGESRILAKRDDRAWMKLETNADGIKATLISHLHQKDQKNEDVWCVDGKQQISAPSTRHKLVVTRGAGDHTPPGAPEADLTALDPDSSGVGHIRWRPAGTAEWKIATFQVKHTTAIDIEALAALPDGGLLGGTRQYHGFFRTDPATRAVTFLGVPSPSQSVIALDPSGLVYITGYPNSVLYAYDPKRPWTGTTPQAATAKDANPHGLGNFTAAGVKYPAYLVAWRDRLYMAGRLERDGVGGGIGYYEPATQRFAGQHDNLVEVAPAGLVTLPAIDRIVMSTRLRDKDPNPSPDRRADLVVYDPELKEVERLTVKPGLPSTGAIYPTTDPTVILGVAQDEQAVYRYDVANKKLLDWKDPGGATGAGAQRPSDRSLWLVAGPSLVRVDPHTLETKVYGGVAEMPTDVEHLVWQGDDLFFTEGSELYRIARVGLP